MTRSASASSAYDEDFFSWTQDQAAALRRAGAHGDIDVDHLAEEIEDLGKRDLREVTSLLRLLFLHLMKIETSPQAPSVPHWRSEAREFRLSAVRTFTPGMAQLIDVSMLWREAVKRFGDDLSDWGLPQPSIPECPFDLSDVLSDMFELDSALTKIAKARDGSCEVPRPPLQA